MASPIRAMPTNSVTPLPTAFFTDAVASLRRAQVRADIDVEEIEAPQRLAPFTYAVGGHIGTPEGSSPGISNKAAMGRLVLLYDPAGHEAWQGTTRLVAFITCRVEPDIASDPALAEVTWTSLAEALRVRGASYTALAGAVTTVTSTRFGDGLPEQDLTDIELRASWTPLDQDLAPHTVAWGDVLAEIAGMPPYGVSKLSR